jgi:hypothetical protein
MHAAHLKVKQEFAAKEKTQTAKKTLAKAQTKAVKKAKAAWPSPLLEEPAKRQAPFSR